MEKETEETEAKVDAISSNENSQNSDISSTENENGQMSSNINIDIADIDDEELQKKIKGDAVSLYF